jgi:hypothetical protein
VSLLFRNGNGPPDIVGGPARFQVPMSRKLIELPAAVARAFVKNMRAFLAEKNAIKRDEIAARQLHALKQDCTGKLRLAEPAASGWPVAILDQDQEQGRTRRWTG